MAQKQCAEKTIELNVKKWGTGKININDARVPWDKEPPKNWVANGIARRSFGKGTHEKGSSDKFGFVDANPDGRYPSNVIGSVLPQHQKYFYDPIMEEDSNAYDLYYYSGRVSSKEREGNTHPTPKPVKLMTYLIKLFCPSDGIVLDPFNGSGTTGVAAIETDRKFLGIEIDEEYCAFAKKRLNDFEKSKLVNFFQ